MVASKIDVATPEKLKKLKQWATRKKLKLYPISAVTGEGIEKLKYAMAEEVDKARKAPPAVVLEDDRFSKSSA
jgi:GTP-binding protein